MPIRPDSKLLSPDHIPINRWELTVPPLINSFITFTTVSGVEEELQTVTLPDRTVVSGGYTMPVEFTATQPMHHKAEVKIMEAWYVATQVGVAYNVNAGILKHVSLSGINSVTYTLFGIFPNKRKLPDLDLANEGEMALIEWTFQCNYIKPI